MSRDATWTNDDGLIVGFGTHTEDNNVAAVYSSSNGVVSVAVEYDLVNDLPDTFAATNVKPQDHVFPRGSVIVSAYCHTLVTPTSGTASTFDLGMWGVGLATEVVDDADGIFAALSDTEMDQIGSACQADGAYILDSDDASSTQYAVGSISDSDCVLAPSYNTVFTAGKVRVIVNYIPPAGSAGRTLLAVNT